ncbi:uncharacterized protein A4U43_C05F19170 [Asparagus officinalis]|uniref:Major facilitator superfamily (MFS) profile domain-containing protein n=1 Tax=Asparagus officinalis TaxID=4686 RepID=A0A5P1EWM6_ASPOF|nr:uncharacterized protein A4U43_C05F19170 [Asparagus officinalis]
MQQLMKPQRFLNKACIIRNPEKQLNPDGSAINPWTLCTVQQVEDFKSVVRVLPLWSTCIIPAVVISQHSFPVVQANTMDRHVSREFQIPAGSFVVFGIVTLTLWVVIYDRIIVPPLSKITGRPRGFSLKQRMGIGFFLSIIATATAALIETKRRHKAIDQGLQNNAKAIVDMSAMWLILQHCLTGLSEAFFIIGQIEFYYSEFPKSMASIGVSLFALGMGIGNLVGSLIVSVLERVTGKNGGESWVADNLNKGHYDYYYWLLAVLSGVNFFYFLVCSWIYGEEGLNKVHAEKEDDVDDDDDHTALGDEMLEKSPKISVIL